MFQLISRELTYPLPADAFWVDAFPNVPFSFLEGNSPQKMNMKTWK